MLAPWQRKPGHVHVHVHDHNHDHDHDRPRPRPRPWRRRAPMTTTTLHRMNIHHDGCTRGPGHRATWRTAETMEGGIAVPSIIGSPLSLCDVDNKSLTEVLLLWLTSWRERASGLSASESSMNLKELTSVENPSALFT